MAQGEAVVSYNTLDLVELGQVCGVQGLISEHTVNGEVLGWCEGLLLGQAMEGTGTGRCGMCPKQIFPGLVQLPIVFVPLRAVATLGVRPLDPMDVVHGEL